MDTAEYTLATQIETHECSTNSNSPSKTLWNKCRRRLHNFPPTVSIDNFKRPQLAYGWLKDTE